MKNKQADLSTLFNLMSVFPLLFSLVGLYVLYLFFIEEFSRGFIVMLASFVLYVIYNVLINIFQTTTLFNEYLEDLGGFLLFGVTLMVFGMMFYSGDFLLVLSVFFFSVCTSLALARNWVLKVKNSVGWPVALNGLIFPLIYYFYIFYLDVLGKSIFIIYFMLVGLFSISRINFLGYNEIVDGKEFVYNREDKNLSKKKNENNIKNKKMTEENLPKEKEIGKKLDALLSRLKGNSNNFNNPQQASNEKQKGPEIVSEEKVEVEKNSNSEPNEFEEIDVSSMKENKENQGVDYLDPKNFHKLTGDKPEGSENEKEIEKKVEGRQKEEGEFDYHKFDDVQKKKHDYLKDLIGD